VRISRGRGIVNSPSLNRWLGVWSLRPASAGGVRADATSKGERLRGWLFSRGNIPAKTIVPVFKLFLKR